jgi:hypothetical protein
VISVGIDKIDLIRYYPHWNTLMLLGLFSLKSLFKRHHSKVKEKDNKDK